MQNKGYSREWLDKLIYNSDIVSTISRYLTLTRKGNTYWACCPFHHEKTPSFAVNQQGQFYHCFGCGASGNVITFVEKMEGTDFVDTVKMLAGWAGMEVPEFQGDEDYLKRRKHRELLQNICRDSAIYYHNVLKSKDGAVGLNYLLGRGVDSKTITKLGLGYSNSWQGLVNYLLKKGYKRQDLIDAGVCDEKNNRIYDAMAERVVFPVIDHNGKVVGFSGRAIKNDSFAKYKNTKATEIFNKSSNIYCINLLRKARLEKNYAILVEGQMDVVALQQAGFSNAIATMGTAFNKNHVQTLSRFVDAVVVCFDGDNAGQKAIARSLEPLGEEGFEIKVLSLPEKLDPDEFIKKYGSEAYQKLIDNAMPVYEFEINYEASKHNFADKDEIPKFVDACIGILSTIPKESEREIYIKLVAKISGVPRESILRQLMFSKNKAVASTETPQVAGQTKNYKAEQFVLASILHKKPWALSVDIEDFVNNNLKNLYKYLLANNFPKVSKLFEDFDVENSTDIKAIINYDFTKITKPEEEFSGCLAKMQLDSLLRRQEAVGLEIVNCTNEQMKISLLNEANEISKKIIEIKTLLNKVG